MLLKCNYNKVFLTLLVLITRSHFALASNKVGNGGDIIHCKKTQSKPAITRLLDFFEVEPETSVDIQDPFEAARVQFQKLAPIAPALAELYTRRSQEIKNEIDFKSEIKLTNIEDSLHLMTPLSLQCSVLQIAIKKNQGTSFEKKFLISKDLWDQLSVTHQTGLLTHEIIYEHFYNLGEEDSVKTRKLNAFLFQKTLTSQEFWKFIKELKVPIYP